ncbi:MAG: hypothetical protein JW701_03815 [Kosmotogaceae bacterium]|nr:hypothetical protein [Kosmotogaceae bacterium]
MDFRTVHENRGYVPSSRKGKAKCPTCGETLKYTNESLRNLSKFGFSNGHLDAFEKIMKYCPFLVCLALFFGGSGAAPLMNSSSRKKMG